MKIDGNLTTVGSFGAKLATQVDVNGTVTVTPPQNGAAQVMVYGTMNVTGTLDVTTGAMGAVLPSRGPGVMKRNTERAVC